VNEYLQKHSFRERFITEPPADDTYIIVVIPCHDEPGLIATLQSLTACERPDNSVEVIVVVNSGENDKVAVLVQNKKTLAEVKQWTKAQQEPKLKFYFLDVMGLPERHAGVGLARKIGMDEAVRRFDDINNHEGVIVCLDADCTVDKNYLRQIERHFKWDTVTPGCSIYFEHPIEGVEYPKEIYEGIINYELFLRYYCLGLRYAGFPYPFQTIGSSMAVRSSTYQKQGGMNRRKAGEDFYFLHKIFQPGRFTNLTTTTVYPSPRPSHRVPFGTGSAIQKYISAYKENYFVYNIESFFLLKDFFAMVPSFYNGEPNKELMHDSIIEFLQERNFPAKLREIRQHSASEKMFVKRFFNWFDGFIVLKYVHYVRDNYFTEMEIKKAAIQLMQVNGQTVDTKTSTKELLLLYRQAERSGYEGML
jgi:hypothetical protein